MAAPSETRTPNLHRANQHRSLRVRMEGWRQWWRLGGRKTLSQRKNHRALLTPTGLLMEGHYTQNRTQGPTTRRAITCSMNTTVRRLSPQTLSGVLWRHYLHAEDKSLAPDGRPCGPYTSGLLLRRPIHAMIPFITIGKEVERKAQEGEDIGSLESTGPIRYQSRQTVNTRAVDPELQKRLNRFSLRQLKESGLSRDTIIQARRGARLHPDTRARLKAAVEKLEGSARTTGPVKS